MTNIGDAVRKGLRLKPEEAVALVHEAAVQLDMGVAKALPTSADALRFNESGALEISGASEERQPARAAVATLLDVLLRAVTDEAGTLPPALRSLPARLRASGESKSDSDLKDLLTILRWHLPRDAREVLKDLAVRMASIATPEVTAPIADFAEEPAPAPQAAVPPVVVTKASRTHVARRSALIAAAMLALIVSAFAGYRYSLSPRPAADTHQPAPVVASEPRVIVVPTPREPRPLGLAVNGGAFSPTFTTGARTLLFHAGRNTAGHVFVATLDDQGRPSALTPLLEESARNYHARPSPDGRWIAFDSDREGERAVFMAGRQGTQISRVSGTGFAAVPSWSPDMKSLAFVRGEPGRPRVWNLWIRDLASGDLSRVTHFRSGQVWGASWFPDSASYAYSHEDRLVIADRSGATLASFASPIAGRLVRTPAVSPDGGTIVFQVFRDGAWMLDVKTGAMRRILDDATAEEFAWDPQGRQIAYHSRRDGEWRIWLMTP